MLEWQNHVATTTQSDVDISQFFDVPEIPGE